MNFLEKTLHELSLADEHLHVFAPAYIEENGKMRFQIDKPPREKRPIFTECTEEGKEGYYINYYDLKGDKYYYRKSGVKMDQAFKRIRLETPRTENGKTAKYLSPAESGLFPFFPNKIIQAYLKNQQVKTLWFVEGEKKALKASACGAWIVGLPGIHGFVDKETNRLLPDIVKLIKGLQVENIGFLHDADAMVLKFQKDKDLTQRPKSFAASVTSFLEAVKNTFESTKKSNYNVFYGHIKTRFSEDGKGIDDLLTNYNKEEKSIIHDLKHIEYNSQFFTFYNITSYSAKKIHDLFGVYSNATTFFKKWSDFIGSREFKYESRWYESQGETVAFIRDENSDKYIRVGTDYFKISNTYNPISRRKEENLLGWTKGELTTDFGKGFISTIRKYDKFTSLPAWDKEYEREIDGCFNLMNPIFHDVAPGGIDNTINYLKHVFGGDGNVTYKLEKHEGRTIFDYEEKAIWGDQFTVALDYLTIMFRYPTQKLPVPILLSKEQATGKTTFLEWLCEIYHGNATVINNEIFSSQFNAPYITKFIIGLDEGFLDVEKQEKKERLKQLITSKKMHMNDKGIKMQEFPYFGKLIICSNNVDNVMKMDDEDSRFFVVKVPPIPENKKDNKLAEKMLKEIPAWLYFLATRKIYHENKGRLWFEEKAFITEQFKEIVKNTRTRWEVAFDTWLEDHFIKFGVMELKADLNTFVEHFNGNYRYKIDSIMLQKYFNDRGIKAGANTTFNFPSSYDSEAYHVLYKKGKGRVITLKVEDWVTEENLKLNFKPVKE